MHLIKSMFGVCSNPGGKNEVQDIIRRVFGNEMLLKDNNNLHTQRSKYITYVKENLGKVVDLKTTPHKTKGGRKHSGSHITQEPTEDVREGRIGPKTVVFDAATGTGRLILVGDERVSVQGISSFATIRATACVYSGKWMYEVQLGTKGIMQIGWCTSSCSFSTDTGVGDTSHSYAYDGGRVRKWNVVTSSYGEPWLPGDVIGSCINLDKGTMEFYRNGKSLGIAFDKVPRGSGLAYFPAVSLALQEHLYANFGHVPFVFPVEGFQPIQCAPSIKCARASVLFRFVDALLDEFTHPYTSRPPSTKNSKVKILSTKTTEEEVALRIHSEHSMWTAKPSPNVLNADEKLMSKKAFLMSLIRLVFIELGIILKSSYVVIAELLPRIRASLGLMTTGVTCDPIARTFYLNAVEVGYLDLAKKLRKQPQARLCTMLDWFWTFLDESSLCDILEHCIVRECLLFDLVSQDMKFKGQIEDVYVLCGLMQHRETRQHLVKYVFFNKISFDNFLNIKCPDEKVLRSIIRAPWWQQPTSVIGEMDPKIKNKQKDEDNDDDELKRKYKEDCDKITAAIAPLEQIQLEFLLILLDNADGTNIVPSTRKIFIEKFRRYIMDNCILDMRLFNVSRNSPAISWCCHDRLLSAIAKLWVENPLGNSTNIPMHIPTNSFLDGELDFYNVDRLGGVLPFLVRTLRQDLVTALGEDNLFIQSFDPIYNRSGGLDTDVMAAISPRSATLPQVISSMARFLNASMAPITPRNPEETVFTLKGTPSIMPGAGSIDIKTAYLCLVDGLLALYHGAAVKHDEKLCEVRDNQLDMADCLHDINQRIEIVTKELEDYETSENKEFTEKRALMENVLKELQRSKRVYEEKLEGSALQMAWVIGAIWTRRRQQNLAKQFIGVLHSMRLASDSGYAADILVASKEILQDKSSMLGNSSYASLELQYTSSSDQSPTSPISITTDGSGSQSELPSRRDQYAASLFAFVPEYHVDSLLELCNTLRLYMHPTVPLRQIPEWEELVVSCASFLCAEFADQRIILASTRESLVQTLASFATQIETMRAIERVSGKQQMSMVEQLLKPYQNRAWAQSNWVLVRFWHGSGFGFHHRQWPHLAARYGDRAPTVNNLGAKVDAGLMSQCFGPCPSEVVQCRIREYLVKHPKESTLFLNSLLTQLNWAFSEFITMMQEMDHTAKDTQLEARQVKLCATCFDLYHGLCRALEMTLSLLPYILTKSEASDKQNELLLGRTCQLLMAVVSRVCVRTGGGAGFVRLVARGLPEMDRVHFYVALAPVAGCLIEMLNPKLTTEHLGKVTKALVNEPLFRADGLEFMLGRGKKKIFSFYDFPEDVTAEELHSLECVIERLQFAQDSRSPGSSAQSELLCTICYARPADTAFVPCGHNSCRACIMQHLLNNNQCFFCKNQIESVKEIEAINL